jgi:hypothetical protein
MDCSAQVKLNKFGMSQGNYRSEVGEKRRGGVIFGRIFLAGGSLEGSPGIAMVNASFQITRECVANLIGVYNTRMSVVRSCIVLSLYTIL